MAEDVKNTVGNQVDLFVLQYEIAPADADMPDGIWSDPEKIHSDLDGAECEIVAERAKENHCGQYGLEGNTYRIVKVLGEVVSVHKPKEDEE